MLTLFWRPSKRSFNLHKRWKSKQASVKCIAECAWRHNLHVDQETLARSFPKQNLSGVSKPCAMPIKPHRRVPAFVERVCLINRLQTNFDILPSYMCWVWIVFPAAHMGDSWQQQSFWDFAKLLGCSYPGKSSSQGSSHIKSKAWFYVPQPTPS